MTDERYGHGRYFKRLKALIKVEGTAIRKLPTAKAPGRAPAPEQPPPARQIVAGVGRVLVELEVRPAFILVVKIVEEVQLRDVIDQVEFVVLVIGWLSAASHSYDPGLPGACTRSSG